MKNYLAKLLDPKPNGPEIGILLAGLLGAKITDTTLTAEIEEHPAYPSLLSISDALTRHGIENIGIKFKVEKFSKIPTPFISQIRGTKSSLNFFTVVKSIDNGITHYFDPEKHQWAYLPNADFLKRCSRIALISEANDRAGENDYDKKVLSEKRKNAIQYLGTFCFPTIVVVAGIISLLQYGVSALLPFIFSVLTILGGIVGVLLLLFELDQHNTLLKQICSANKKVNCSALLQSKAAKIAGVSWSTIGFSYFAGFLLLLLFWGVNSPTALFVVSWINAMAVPYVVFSIYYQWRIAKQWCVLCLFVQGVLLLQLAAAYLGGWYAILPGSAVTAIMLLQALTAFTLPFVVINILMPALKKAREGRRFNTQLKRIKHNPQIFKALLQKQKELTEDANGLGIVLGHPDAAFRLIKVCNPYCGPCARAHTPMEELLQDNPEVQIRILFTATNNEDDIKARPAKHLLAISDANDDTIMKRALGDWYLPKDKDYEKFSDKYPLSGELGSQTAKIEAMQNWCEKVKIEFTPTFFISLPNDENGQSTGYYQLPEIYSVSDLKYFLSA